ncbi:Kinesin-related protein 6 [Sparganum proliferum]
MVKASIKTFLRLKPSTKPSSIAAKISRKPDLCKFYIVDKKPSFEAKRVDRFTFADIFEPSIAQEDIFREVAKPVIENALAGYNGTIFAYGQSGSGKTYTMTGGSELFTNRGLIPRAIAYLFDKFAENPNVQYLLKISYLELYNDVGYDLIGSGKRAVSVIDDLPRILVYEDGATRMVHLKNLNLHCVSTAEDAMSLLFRGDTNRVIAETPLNPSSTRSHCIFTFHISAKSPDSFSTRSSKLHLVDLAGSERVYKTGLSGTLLNEAKCINLSLHYLEQVITALSENNRTHVPYRNSMLTMILRDSLGGNCMTSMIATVSMDSRDRDETISTCRFAQRVAMITNEVEPNEEMDPGLVIANLKSEVERLRTDLMLARETKPAGTLDDSDKLQCENTVRAFLKATEGEGDAGLLDCLMTDLNRILYAFHVIRRVYQAAVSKNQHDSITPEDSQLLALSKKPSEEEERLRELVKQRDQEINVLLNMLKKMPTSSLSEKKGERPSSSRKFVIPTITTENVSNKVTHINDRCDKNPCSSSRSDLYEQFKRDHHSSALIEMHKEFLRKQYAEAKRLGECLNEYKAAIAATKLQLSSASSTDSTLRNQLANKNQNYLESFQQLAQVKVSIEHTQHQLQTLKAQMLQEFEVWWSKEYASMVERPTTQKTYPSPRSVDSLGDSLSAQSEQRHEDGDIRTEDITLSIPLTGDPFVDADILEFVRSREICKRTRVT